MGVKLTRELIETKRARLRALADAGENPKPADLRDSERAGLVARVTKTGLVTFYLDYRNAAGRRRWFKLGRYGRGFGLKEARTLALRNQNATLDGEDPSQTRKVKRDTTAATLGAFIDGTYTDTAQVMLKSASALLRRLRAGFKGWWGEPISTIDKARVKAWRAERRKSGVKPATINRDVAALSAVLSAAADEGLIPANPIARQLKPLKTDDSRVRYLAPDELERLHAAIRARDAAMIAKRDRANEWRSERGYPLLPALPNFGDHITPVVILALNTGMRRGEILGLSWRAVQFQDNIITVAGETDETGAGGSKSGRTRHIPMSKAARAVLEQWKEQQSLVHKIRAAGLVFPAKDGSRMFSIKTAWGHLVNDAELTDFRFHDCRHHFCSTLVQRGVPLVRVRDLAGHSTIALTERYSHLAPNDLADAVAVLDLEPYQGAPRSSLRSSISPSHPID